MSEFFKENEEFVNSSINNESVNTTEETQDYQTTAEPAEGSYEWNADGTEKGNEYHYSYVNGNNQTAPHNPNNYDNDYSTRVTANDYEQYNNTNNNPYGYTNNTPYNTSNQPYSNAQANKKKAKKAKKPASKGFVAVMLVFSLVLSGAVGFFGGYIAKQTNNNGAINVNKVESSSTQNIGTPTAANTSEIVKKTADSVVEIVTGNIVRGKYTEQYVTQGAGSGVIISEDGYIVTNHHVIDGANSIKVTLRDGTNTYDAKLVGSDKTNDIALLKIDATGLTAATIGDSSNLNVGDYVIAIGNPLGELGGTVTDGIISALAREVTIEGNNMTLLQTNAQISPGNSGGGLFNANGELVGIVNAKDSATEVEGIAFAIPINTAIKIVEDLKSYGYAKGQIDIGMELTDITSRETAFFYGVNNTGCYVASVDDGLNAEEAGFKSGDLITKVNDQEVTTSAEVEAICKECKIGDQVNFEVYRNGKRLELTLTLIEYVPSGVTSTTTTAADSDRIWNEMFGGLAN